MHYFSPVPKMPLLEIVVTDQTSPEAVARARAFGIAQGKTCIVVSDGPGFYTTRILAPYLNEAILLLEEGARIEEVDRHLKDLGFPVGPVALIDEVGIDVGAHVALDLGRAFAERGLAASNALPRLLDAGYEGRKNGHGFYLYPPPGTKKGRKRPNTAIYAHLGGGARKGTARQSINRTEAQDRLALLMVNEAVHCLQEGVISCPRDGDVGAVMGLGFPPFLAGPFHWVDTLSAAAVVQRLKQLAEAHGPRFTPARRLRDMAADGSRFYPRLDPAGADGS
jgi:3-hydroxyacyl-CoA dehydrogenase/enoyl-CoA hydratase/3-hydroxybutyryl-CoA epimerase